MNRKEQAVYQTIRDLEPRADTTSIYLELRAQGSHMSVGGLHLVVDQLERDGLIVTHLAEPTPERSGHPKRFCETIGSRTPDEGRIAGLPGMPKPLLS